MAKKKSRGKRYSTKRNPEVQSTRLRKLRRILFTILVVLIVAAVIFFLVLRSSGQISIFENAVGTLVTPVQNAFRSVTTGVKDFFTDRKSLSELQQAYDALSLENEQLRMELQEAEEAVQENENLKTLLDARDTYSSLEPVYAKVIARDAGPWFDTFSVNRGSNSGVTTGMAVVNGDGLIGRVYEVGLNYSKVISIIDSRSSVACLMQRTRDNGVLSGQLDSGTGSDSCYMYYLPAVNSVTPGDRVITSGLDSMYPKGLLVGTVSEVSRQTETSSQYIVVTPLADFNHIEEVLVLRTVIETDSDQALPVVPEPTARPTATPDPNATETPVPESTPAPSNAPNEWAYPTVTPDGNSTIYSGETMPEDAWAAG